MHHDYYLQHQHKGEMFMANKILVLDAGHGFNTAGKQTMNGSRGVVKEWTMNSNVCNKIANILKDYDVTIYRTDDTSGKTDISLSERVRRCNNYKPDLFVSIHHNAGGGTGTEVYWHSRGTAEDKKVAGIVTPKLASKTGMRNRGVKQAAFAVLGCNATAILVEGGFMDTKADYEIITSDKGQQQYAEAVAESIIEYLGLKKTVVSQPSQPSTSTSLQVGDKVKVKAQATHYAPTDGSAQGKSIPSWVNGSTYTVTKINGNKILVSDIVSWLWDYDLEKVGSATVADTSFKVKITCNALTIRQSDSFDSKAVGTVYKNEIYTITQASNGLGKLKSGAGWISMGSAYVQKV